MKNYRLSKDVTGYYTSFEELATKEFGCKPYKKLKRTNDEEKLKKQREAFCSNHRCKACGEPLAYVTDHWMTCVNEKCKGIKVEKTDKDGNKIASYIVSCEELWKDRDVEIAHNLFS